LSHFIENLISKGENQHLDFKFEISDAKKIARTLSAFANTEGGRLLIGVKDNGKITGVKTDEEAYMIESAADLYCKPKVKYRIRHHVIQQKTILEVFIPESDNKPHVAPWKANKWEAFIRVHDQNFIADDVMKEVWKIKHQDKKFLFRFKNYEQQLFELLQNKKEISQQEFITKCKIPKHLSTKILANLLVANIITVSISESNITYKLC